MKIKTSITLSDYLVEQIDSMLSSSENRSNFIEEAVKKYIELKRRRTRDRNDLEILNSNIERLNREAEDVLSYQVKI